MTMGNQANNEDGELLGLAAYTNEELAMELLSRSKSGVVLMRFDNEKGPRRMTLFNGNIDEVIGILDNEVFFQKYMDAKNRFNEG